eukprot:symbB.v1.2.034662.t1/scaffold4513.1/size38631/2
MWHAYLPGLVLQERFRSPPKPSAAKPSSAAAAVRPSKAAPTPSRTTMPVAFSRYPYPVNDETIRKTKEALEKHVNDEMKKRDETIRKTKEVLEKHVNDEMKKREETIRKTREVLEKHLRQAPAAPVHRSGKRGRSSPPQEPYPPPKKDRKGWSGSASSSCAQPEYDDDDEAEPGYIRYDEYDEDAELAQPQHDDEAELAQTGYDAYNEDVEDAELAQPEQDDEAELAQPEQDDEAELAQHDDESEVELAQPGYDYDEYDVDVDAEFELHGVMLLSMKIDVDRLRFSQRTCKKKFWCGRTITGLVQDLLHGRVTLSEPFLRLSVFEDTDRRTNETILRCKDNRRLLALKQYAKKCGGRVLAHATLFTKDMIREMRNYIRNTDDTDGRDVIVRPGKKGGRRKNRYW